ncbi:MAG: hypothetical protein IJY79_05935 [Clostridia bacterium]|nr:hypothetical protein [Clostridia bacterium]
MFKIKLEYINELHNIFFELATITYLQNVIRDENSENNFYIDGFEFLKREGTLYLLDKQTEAILKLKELLFKDEFNIGEP